MSDTDIPRAACTNVQVGKEIGLHFAMVSRLRSGGRGPSVKTMLAIRDAYGWPTNEQADAYAEGTYHTHFEDVLVRKYGRKETNDKATASPTPSR